MFNARHYKPIAECFRVLMSQAETEHERNMIRVVALAQAKMFADDNSKFKSDLFLTACGFGPDYIPAAVLAVA